MKPNRARIYSTPRALILTILSALAGMFVMTGASMLYANYVDRKSNQAWCEMMTGLDKRYQALPANADPEALEFAQYIRDLIIKFDC